MYISVCYYRAVSGGCGSVASCRIYTPRNKGFWVIGFEVIVCKAMLRWSPQSQGELPSHSVLTAVAVVVLQLGVDGMKAGTMNHTMKWFMRAMPIVMLPLISNFPAVSQWVYSDHSILLSFLFFFSLCVCVLSLFVYSCWKGRIDFPFLACLFVCLLFPHLYPLSSDMCAHAHTHTHIHTQSHTYTHTC